MKHYLFVCFLCATLNIYSQSKESIQNTYQAYFELPRETLYTHLNKTTFIAGEEVWFKTYVFDRHENLPSKATTNINVGVYDESGKLIRNDLWLAQNGSANGNFFIDSTFTTGDYYIKASTNWMRNFEENDAYIQKIKIIGNDINKNKLVVKKNNYDFQFLPEGGYIIYDLNNTLGFKITDSNNKGLKISGTIYNDNNQEITTFKSNDFGIGKCSFRPNIDQSYFAKINLPNGNVIRKDIIDIRTNGIALSVNSTRAKDVLVNISTNQFTHNSIKEKVYTLLIHKNGKSKSMTFSFKTSKNKLLRIPKKDLFNGINILTVFDENEQALIERLIFNSSKSTDASPISISQIKTENDSLYLSLYSLDKQNSNKTINNISISVLPHSTSSYNPDQNIISATQLKPYIKGYIEDPKYYFTKVNYKKLYELDLLLLTQGWSRYNWNSIFNNTPKAIFEFENGVTLKGKINDSKKITTLRLQDPKLKGFSWSNVPVKSDNTFEVKNYYPLKNEIIRLSYFDKNGKLAKPNLYVSCMLNSADQHTLNQDILTKYNHLIELTLPKHISFENFFYKDNIVLDEVILQGTSKQKKVDDAAGKINNITFKNNYTHITQDIANRFHTILDYIGANGYNVSRSTQFGNVQIRRNIVSSINASQSPVVFFDNSPISDFNFLTSVYTSDVEGIIIDKNGFGTGMNGANGVIRIYSRKTPLGGFINKQNPYAHESKVNVGFTKSKIYYSPKYKNYNDDLYKNYGTIGWFPNINLEHNNSIVLKIPNTKTQKLNFYIEGTDNKGNLISEVKTISVTN